MDIPELLDRLYKIAAADPALTAELIKTRDSGNAYSEFCRIARENGCELYPMELLEYGEQAYGDMKRSTNGGGENSPMMEGQDDLYELFLARLEIL